MRTTANQRDFRYGCANQAVQNLDERIAWLSTRHQTLDQSPMHLMQRIDDLVIVRLRRTPVISPLCQVFSALERPDISIRHRKGSQDFLGRLVIGSDPQEILKGAIT